MGTLAARATRRVGEVESPLKRLLLTEKLSLVIEFSLNCIERVRRVERASWYFNQSCSDTARMFKTAEPLISRHEVVVSASILLSSVIIWETPTIICSNPIE